MSSLATRTARKLLSLDIESDRAHEPLEKRQANDRAQSFGGSGPLKYWSRSPALIGAIPRIIAAMLSLT
ncbi:hypothetical protein EVAR_61827_1 [Eumeta japonica]|uniref:Uncharacterized protein n=1 Tax=Eumeta variegata TaxID=151549 RepID=A0A4C1YWT9_EUMVA|nr:hypothetical protein EVAR_61827_1 [Eumeta japonica]